MWGSIDYDSVEEEEALKEAWGSFPDAHDVPKQKQEYVEDLLGQPSGKFDYKVLYPKHPPPAVPLIDIEPT